MNFTNVSNKLIYFSSLIGAGFTIYQAYTFCSSNEEKYYNRWNEVVEINPKKKKEEITIDMDWFKNIILSFQNISDSKCVSNIKESFTLVAISLQILRKSVTSDPSYSLMNFAEFSSVMTCAIYVRDYLIDQKIIPT